MQERTLHSQFQEKDREIQQPRKIRYKNVDIQYYHMEEKVAPKIYTCKPNSNTTGKTTGSNRHLTILATKKR